MIPIEIPNASAISQNSTSLAQGDSLQNYERKFTELLDDQKLSKQCSDAGFLKEIGKGHFFITIEEGCEVMQTASKSENIPTERVDSFEHEYRPSFGCQKSIFTKDVIVLIS